MSWQFFTHFSVLPVRKIWEVSFSQRLLVPIRAGAATSKGSGHIRGEQKGCGPVPGGGGAASSEASPAASGSGVGLAKRVSAAPWHWPSWNSPRWACLLGCICAARSYWEENRGETLVEVISVKPSQLKGGSAGASDCSPPMDEGWLVPGPDFPPLVYRRGVFPAPRQAAAAPCGLKRGGAGGGCLCWR